MDDLVKMARGESTAHFEGNVRDRRTIGALLSSLADAIEALQARVKELDTTISNLRKVNEQYLKNSNENFHAANTARRDAFEEAAKVADKWAADQQRQFGNGGPASAIRDLAEKG
jgi:ElaB/YqjD/DUF883 family membrane-anchored ribosome-binding protein